MEATDLTTTESLMSPKQKFQSVHQKSYARTRNGRSDGLGYRLEWIVVDPEQFYKVCGVSATEEGAWRSALL